MRNFITITPTEYNEKLAESLRARELELLAYDFEKQNHEEALVSITSLGKPLYFSSSGVHAM